MRWTLREVMARHNIYQTSRLVPLLAEQGIRRHRSWVFRLVTKTPPVIEFEVLAALCRIFACGVEDLFESDVVVLTAQTAMPKAKGEEPAKKPPVHRVRPNVRPIKIAMRA